MSVTNDVRSSLKRVKKRSNISSKENKGSGNEMNCGKDPKNLSPTTQTGPVTLTKGVIKETTLNDPAIVAAGKSRRQPLSKKSDISNVGSNIVSTFQADGVEKTDNKPAITTIKSHAISDKVQGAVPKAPRALRKGRSSSQPVTAKISPKTASEEDEYVVCTPKTTTKKERGSAPTAATPPRFQVPKSKRERTTSISTKANDSIESEVSHHDDKGRVVRFSTTSDQGATQQDTCKDVDTPKALTKETLAQQAALNEAAVLLAQTTLPGFPHPSLYPKFLASTNVAQQQLASAQVLAQLRAGVEGLKVLKNFSVEPAAAYDASRVPCLADREDVNMTTNIYVNNLPSHTTDDDLLRLGACFGPVKSHKAIINQDTGLCKGYGFVMYENAHDAEMALQQLPLHGLTTSWAKESFSTKLRKLSDNTTSNVYVSNLPLDMSPHQLEQLFAPHLVVSLRILLDDHGTSRGVGFVRLRDRDAAQECIDKLHGKMLSGQSTPLQARFADSEAQKRLKQSISQTTPSAKMTTPAKSNTTLNSLLDNAGFVDPVYLASLQGLQNWAGFGTPQNNSASAFVSPSIGVASPTVNYTQWSPSMAANAAANWNLLTSDVYSNSLLNANNGSYGMNYSNNLYSPSSMSSSLNSPFGGQYSNKSFSPLSFASTPLSATSPTPTKGDNGSRSSNHRSRPTYLPPDVHQQHAKALLEAQAGLTFDGSQAEAFGLSQILLNNAKSSDYYQQQHYSQNPLLYNGNPYLGLMPSQILPGQQPVNFQHSEAMNNALGMSGLASKDGQKCSTNKAVNVATGLCSKDSTVPLSFSSPSRAKVTEGVASVAGAALSPIRFSLSTDPGNPITVEAVDGDFNDDQAKLLTRISTPMPGSTGSPEQGSNTTVGAGFDSVTEEGDSLVIDSGTGSPARFFTSQEETNQVEKTTISKSDSGKVFDTYCQAKQDEEIEPIGVSSTDHHPLPELTTGGEVMV